MDKKMDYRVRWDEVDKKLIKVPTHDLEKTSKRVYKMDEINKLMKMTLEEDVHSLAIQYEQIRRWGKIIYNKDKIEESK